MSSKDPWPDRILAIPEIRAAGLLNWQRIESGSSNHNFKVTTKQGIWVLRFNQATLGINRHQEMYILQQLAALQIMPELIAINPDEGYLISRYSTATTWHPDDFKNPRKLSALQQTLSQFQAITYNHLPSRLDQRIKNYLQHIPAIPVELKRRLIQAIERLEILNFWQANTTLYHSDLNPSNLLGHAPVQIIDWEYAGQGHPLLDWLIMEHHSGADLSAHYPKDLHEQWLKPAKTMITAMLELWKIHSA